MSYSGIVMPLVEFLTAETGTRTVSRRPADLQAVLPINQVVGVGGSSDPDVSRFKTPRVDIGSFAATEGAAEQQAIEVERLIRDVLPGLVLAGLTVTKTETVQIPSWRPYADTDDLFYFGGYYAIYLRTA